MKIKSFLFAICLLFVLSQEVWANAILTLTSLTPENVTGGYLPGTTIDFQVDISQDTGSIIPLRLAQLDFSASELAPAGVFNFDFSSVLLGSALYAVFPDYPSPAVVFTGTSELLIAMLQIPAAGFGSLTLGIGELVLPSVEGDYLLDALNGGAELSFGFGGLSDPITAWSAANGLLIGDPLVLTVTTGGPGPIPEPGTVALMGLGLAGLLLTRRKKV